MNDRESFWNRKTFASGSRRLESAATPSPPAGGQVAADSSSAETERADRAAVLSARSASADSTWLAGRAEGLTEAFVLAHLYERRGGTAGVVRFALEQRLKEAWDEAEAAKQAPDVGEVVRVEFGIKRPHVPEPQSLSVGLPALRLVDGDPAA